MNNKLFREELFYNINGIVVVSAINGLIKTKLIDKMIKKISFTILDISNKETINDGYFNVTLRLLYSVGLLDFKNRKNELNNIFTINNQLLEIFKHKKEIQKLSRMNYYHINFNNLSNDDIKSFVASSVIPR